MSPTQPAAEPKTLLTVDEYWEFVNRPENADRLFELRRGEVIELSRPKKPHGIVCARITGRLDRYVEERGVGYVECNDAGVVLEEDPGTVVGPDVAFFVDYESFEDVAPKWSEIPPILAVEVLSPSDRHGEVMEKVQDYFRAGVRVVWVADPEVRTVTVFSPDRTHVLLKDNAELTGDPHLPGFACKIGDFFRFPGPIRPPTDPPAA